MWFKCKATAAFNYWSGWGLSVAFDNILLAYEEVGITVLQKL